MRVYKFMAASIACIGLLGSTVFMARNYLNEHVSSETKKTVDTTEKSSLELIINEEQILPVVTTAIIETTAEITSEMEVVSTEISETFSEAEIVATEVSSENEDMDTEAYENPELFKFIASWENADLFDFEYNNEFETYNEISEYITPNGKFYVVTRDADNCLNIGYGICIRSNGGMWMNNQYFSEYGIDVTSLKEGDVVSTDIVKEIHKNIINDMRDSVVEKVEEISLTETQIDSLTSIAYQFGFSGSNLSNFIEKYKELGNSDELRKQYTTLGGTYPFIAVRGGQNIEGFTRADANWHLFNSDSYIYG